MVSLTSGMILAVSSWLLTSTVLSDVVVSSVPVWLFVAVIATVALLAILVTRRHHYRTGLAFVMISAFTQTRWLADMLDNLSRSADRHGIDLVVKLPQHDHSGRSQLRLLASLKQKRRWYAGGFIILEPSEQLRSALVDACREIDRPLIFVDVRPFRDAGAYPPRTAFVGCDADEIGERAGRLAGKELSDRGIATPSVLVVAGDAQNSRQLRFAAALREVLPSAEVEINNQGLFSRERASEVVDRYLRNVVRRDGRLDAIFCTNDEMALGAVDAVQKYALDSKRFEDLMIIGVDGTAEAVATIRAGRTGFQATIVQDTRRVAEVAVDLLLRVRAGEPYPVETFVPTTVYPME
jgi:ribose transport system substrate-binding protein